MRMYIPVYKINNYPCKKMWAGIVIEWFWWGKAIYWASLQDRGSKFIGYSVIKKLI